MRPGAATTPCGGQVSGAVRAGNHQVVWSPDLPAFAGHYPAYPIVPGAFLLDAALALEPGHAAGLRPVVRSMRFRAPVFPGSAVTVNRRQDRGVVYDFIAADGGPVARIHLDADAPGRPGRSARVETPAPKPRRGSTERAVQWNRDQLTGLVPHRDPMLLVDSVSECVPDERATGWLRVPPASVCAPEHRTGLPPALLLEAWAQVGAVLTTCEMPVPDVLSGPVLLFGGARGVRFGVVPRPGDDLELTVRVVATHAGATVLTGQCTSAAGTVLSVAQLTIAHRPQGSLPATPPEQRNIA